VGTGSAVDTVRCGRGSAVVGGLTFAWGEGVPYPPPGYLSLSSSAPRAPRGVEAGARLDDCLAPVAAPPALREAASTAQRPLVLGEVRNTPGLLDCDDACAEVNFDMDEFKLRTGTAVRTLRRELPLLFEQDLSYDIYAENITLRDAQHLGAGSLHGKQAYRGWAATLRRFRALFFADVTFTVTGLQLMPRSGRSETCGLMDEIVVRWCVQGTPRVIFAPFLQGQLRWDGQFKYTLDAEGLIEEHVVDNRLFLSNQKPIFSAIPAALFSPPAVAPPMGPVRFAGADTPPAAADHTGLCAARVVHRRCGW